MTVSYISKFEIKCSVDLVDYSFGSLESFDTEKNASHGKFVCTHVCICLCVFFMFT